MCFRCVIMHHFMGIALCFRPCIWVSVFKRNQKSFDKADISVWCYKYTSLLFLLGVSKGPKNTWSELSDINRTFTGLCSYPLGNLMALFWAFNQSNFPQTRKSFKLRLTAQYKRLGLELTKYPGALSQPSNRLKSRFAFPQREADSGKESLPHTSDC